MNRRPITRLAAAAVLTLALGACGAPAGGSTGGSGGSSLGGGTTGGAQPSAAAPDGAAPVLDNGTDDSCFSRFEPTDTGIITGASVKATVFLFCKVAPTSHHLTIRLQRDVGGAWTDQATRTWDDIPGPVPLPKLTSAPCVPGSWRVVFDVWGVAATGKAFQHDGRTGMTKEVKPHDCG